MVFRLVYVSAETRPFGPDELADLLEFCRTRNAADSITGMLLYKEGSFIQVLEGPEEAVRHCYARIVRDPRHTRVTKVFEEHAGRRDFENWTMGFVDGTKVRPADVGAFTRFLQEDAEPPREAPGGARAALLVFRENVR